jgi:hypothetical protein
MNFLQTVLQHNTVARSSSVNVGLSRDTSSITDLFAGRSAPPHGRASAALALGLRGVTPRRSEIR